jgi:hypothetical protein
MFVLARRGNHRAAAFSTAWASWGEVASTVRPRVQEVRRRGPLRMASVLRRVGIMSAEKTPDRYVTPQPIDPTAMHGNGSPGAKRNAFARCAKAMVSGLSSNLEAQIQRRPYATIGIACAIGLGTGVLLGSRILRSVLASAVSYAVVELGRAYLRQGAAPAWATALAGKTNAS